MNKKLINLAKLPDTIISHLYLRICQEKNSLITFVFHGIFNDEKEAEKNLVDPQTWSTISQFKKFVEYYLEHNYKFVSPYDILNGLKNNQKYVMITFDDGYYNNKNVLPILQEFKIPALFFPSVYHIKEKKCFWWDVLYRERTKLKTPLKGIIKERDKLKTMTNEEIEKYIVNLFGNESFKPKSDIDRPFTPTELKLFSKEKYVFIGNHTYNHAILTNYKTETIKSQILNAQKSLQKITGITPNTISYPNGNYSKEILNISKNMGIKLGITVDYRKNYLPINCKNIDCMRLGRFDLSGSDNIIKQCRLFRSDFLIFTKVKKIFN